MKSKKRKTQNPASQNHACDFCAKRYTRKWQLGRHVLKMHAEKPDEAESTINPVDNVLYSIEIESEIPPTVAVSPESNEFVSNAETNHATNIELNIEPNLGTNLEPETKEKQPNEKTAESHPHMCGMCDNRYKSKSGLNEHIRQKHGENCLRLAPKAEKKQLTTIDPKPGAVKRRSDEIALK